MLKIQNWRHKASSRTTSVDKWELEKKIRNFRVQFLLSRSEILRLFVRILGVVIRRVRKITKKRSISFVMYVYLSIRPHGTIRLPLDGFSWNLMFKIFRKSVRKFKFLYNQTRITGTLHDDLCTFMIISGWVILRMRNVSDESCRQNKNT